MAAPFAGRTSGNPSASSGQRRGLATEGAEALVAWAFESHWARLIRARTTREELGAMQVLAKLGFTLIGTADDGRAYLFELEQREEGKS